MAQFVVRDLEEEVKTRLKRRAERHGRSMEEEIRHILRNAVKESGRPITAGTQSTAKRVFEIGVPMPVMPAFFGTPLGEAASLVFRLAREGDCAESRIVDDI